MTYFLKSTYTALVKAGQTEFEVDETDLVEIEDEEFLLIYPSCGLPFYINLISPKDSERVSFVKFSGRQYIILESQKFLKTALKKTLFFSGKKCKITAGEHEITFESDFFKIDVMREKSGDALEIFKIKDFACVQFSSDFYAFSTKNNRITHIVGHVEHDLDTLSVTQSITDNDNCVRHAKFKVTDKIELADEGFERTKTKDFCEMIPYRMLECVKAKDFSYAQSFLSEKLKNSINSTQISDFFGNFFDFLPISTTEFITISPNKKNFVTFEIENDKICDINVEQI